MRLIALIIGVSAAMCGCQTTNFAKSTTPATIREEW
jgi:hypothetical protein